MLIAICDDESIIRNEIKKQLMGIELEYDIDEFCNGQELVDSDKDYDLIFLDIEMPVMDGMRTAELLRKKGNKSYIIFLTSHTEFMPKAFKVKAFRFLNKPIEDENFIEAVNEVQRELQDREIIEIIGENKSSIALLSDIVCFEAFGDGTYVYTKEDVFTSNKPLKYWCERIGEKHFFQVHKSYMVDLRYVKIIENSQVTLHNMKRPVPISRRKVAQFRNAYKEYIRENARYV